MPWRVCQHPCWVTPRGFNHSAKDLTEFNSVTLKSSWRAWNAGASTASMYCFRSWTVSYRYLRMTWETKSEKIWSISSCVCPTMRKFMVTDWKICFPTTYAQKAPTNPFLAWATVLSTCRTRWRGKGLEPRSWWTCSMTWQSTSQYASAPWVNSSGARNHEVT